ncbi:MAG: precorrin-6y C5,15-methyltransferase (decarboxylating) subunit CbiE [Micromonosporaceae bacterium]|nr:precorrin-6y C5,15-methyltransferase (decarboxylating) subunit CbiE [Micromonosporaceae bacterium]
MPTTAPASAAVPAGASPPSVLVVGIGADGWDGLAGPGRAALRAARVVLGGERQLALLPAGVGGRRIAWPSPLLPALPGLLADHADHGLCVLASGDPMWYGIGARLAGLLGPERLTVLPHPSAVSLACARMGWPVESVTVIRATGPGLDRVRRAAMPGGRLVVLSADATTAASLAGVLADAGFGASRLTLLESLGAPAERRVEGDAGGWRRPAGDPLNVVAVSVAADHPRSVRSTVPGLPDSAFDHDGAITKRELRALALARLAPVAGQLLWDVGAGAGSVGIEWLRAAPAARAVAVESRPDRAEQIAANARRLGVPELATVVGEAPAALAGLPAPDAVFVGGGVTTDGLVEACWAALPAAGRLVAHAVTIEGEQVLVAHARRRGGDLTRVAVDRAAPLGGFTGWQPARPVVQWAVDKP